MAKSIKIVNFDTYCAHAFSKYNTIDIRSTLDMMTEDMKNIMLAVRTIAHVCDELGMANKLDIHHDVYKLEERMGMIFWIISEEYEIDMPRFV